MCCLPKKISKANLEIEAIGSIDETNSFVGLCRVNCKDKNVDKLSEKVQNNLFRIGAELANMGGSYKNKINTTDLKELENTIDKIYMKLLPLRHFIVERRVYVKPEKNSAEFFLAKKNYIVIFLWNSSGIFHHLENA